MDEKISARAESRIEDLLRRGDWEGVATEQRRQGNYLLKEFIQAVFWEAGARIFFWVDRDQHRWIRTDKGFVLSGIEPFSERRRRSDRREFIIEGTRHFEEHGVQDRRLDHAYAITQVPDPFILLGPE